eukprot:6999122-Prymnesium_polylepis.1
MSQKPRPSESMRVPCERASEMSLIALTPVIASCPLSYLGGVYERLARRFCQPSFLSDASSEEYSSGVS